MDKSQVICSPGFLELRQAEQARGQICQAASSLKKMVLQEELVTEGELG